MGFPRQLIIEPGCALNRLGTGLISEQEARVGFHCAKAHKSTHQCRCEGFATLETTGELNFGLVVRRECVFEKGAAWLMRIHPQSPAMGVDHRAAYRKTDTHSARLCRIEGFENALSILRNDAGP
jgi:hypothetical protein